MAINVFSIEPDKDVHLGYAGDIQTLVSLIDLSSLRPNNNGVSLHGQIGPIEFSGEYPQKDAICHVLSESQFGANRSTSNGLIKNMAQDRIEEIRDKLDGLSKEINRI